jgi:hypothetical protein
LPRDEDGNLNFTSIEDLDNVPVTGRAPNQGTLPTPPPPLAILKLFLNFCIGFEGLTLDSENGILYAMLQSATMQDGGPDKETNRYTRLFGYDVSTSPPELVGEWVVPLPQSNNKGKTRACSEIHSLGSGIFLALSRDSDGRGGDDTESKYK